MKVQQLLLDRTPPTQSPPDSDSVAFRFDSATGRVVAINADSDEIPVGSILRTGTPVSGVKATRTLTSTGVAPANGATVTIGSRTYTFQTTLTNVAGNVLIGVSAAVALDNLKSAINGTAGAGTTYAAATTAHPDVTATTNTDTTQVIEAIVAGTGGNAIAVTETSTVLSFPSATLTGGIDGTPATAWDTLVDASFLYVATANLTTSSTSGWKKISLTAL